MRNTTTTTDTARRVDGVTPRAIGSDERAATPAATDIAIVSE